MHGRMLFEMIEYTSDINSLTPEDFKDFFDDFTVKPSLEKRLLILKNSTYRIIAKHDGKVIGFINAISDKTFTAYISLLEVLPEYRCKGIGRELLSRMLDMLKDHYMIDTCCDEPLEEFYIKFGMKKISGMVMRNYDKI